MKQNVNYFGLAFLLTILLSMNVSAQNITQRIKKADVQPKRERMPNIINKLLDDEYAPTISADGRTLVYQSNRGGKSWQNNRLWESKRDTTTGFWTDPTPIDAINSKAGEGDFIGMPFLSYDGNTLYFSAKMSGSQNEDIFVSKREGKSWGAPTAVAGVNGSGSELAPSLSPDGARLYFSRNEGGSAGDTTGGKIKATCYKIMVAELDANGNFGAPKELASPVNAGCDKFFRIMPDGQSAFFSSTRGGGSPMSRNDFNLYFTRMNAGGAWSEPVMVDMNPIVKTTMYSYQPEAFVSIAPNEGPHVVAYFSAYMGSSYELFTYPLPDQFKPGRTCFFHGTVIDSITGQPVAATIKITNDTRNSLSRGEMKNEEANGGRFGSVLTEGNRYTITVSHADYQEQTFTADLTNFDQWTSCERVIKMQKLGVNATITAVDKTTNEPVDATIALTADDAAKGKVEQLTKKSTGVYTALIAPGTTYTAVATPADATTYTETRLVIDATNKVAGDTLNRIIVMEFNIGIVFDNINFNTARPRNLTAKELQASLLPRSIEILNQVLAFMKDYPNARISIQGNTDDVGGEAYNQGLSERRAAAAKAYLVKKGVKAERIETKGFGETSPTVPNMVDGKPDKNNRALNRRVEFKVLSK
ncbi:MAG TPA: OmpA family protein [Flavisolibacter sp.]|nr:OmpA family protein [Flavisolibacter sp.]